jgi:hypothetical protein
MARRKILPKALDIDFRGGLTEEMSPHAGVALPVEAGRISGVMGAAEKHLPAKKPLTSDIPAPSSIRNHRLGVLCTPSWGNTHPMLGALLSADCP